MLYPFHHCWVTQAVALQFTLEGCQHRTA